MHVVIFGAFAPCFCPQPPSSLPCVFPASARVMISVAHTLEYGESAAIVFVKERGSRPLKYAGKMTQVKLAQLFEQHQVMERAVVVESESSIKVVALIEWILCFVRGEADCGGGCSGRGMWSGQRNDRKTAKGSEDVSERDSQASRWSAVSRRAPLRLGRVPGWLCGFRVQGLGIS